MAPVYKVIGSAKTRTLRVLWMIHELGLPFEHRPAPPRSADVTALNPLGRIPVLIHGSDILTDSVAIMAWLGDQHPDLGPDDAIGGLSHPAGSVARAQQDALALRLIDEFDALLWTKSRHRFLLPEKLRVPDVLPSLDQELCRNAARLADTLGDQPFLMGEKMTIPDLLASHLCGWAITGGVGLDPPDNLAAYLKRMRRRPAYRRAPGHVIVLARARSDPFAGGATRGAAGGQTGGDQIASGRRLPIEHLARAEHAGARNEHVAVV